MDAKQKALIDDYVRACARDGEAAWDRAEGQALLATFHPATEAAAGTVIGWWDSTSASGFRWREGIVRSDFKDGMAISVLANAPAGAVSERLKSITTLPPVQVREFYGDDYSASVLLHDGEKFLDTVAWWSFAKDAWVDAGLKNGPSPSDYEHLNAKPMRWMLLADALELP
ncbi:hypothetical protein [Paraburkholderia youngii]|uniref:hypothetical protein n=1 Tax=Paraburkholderia youngii TaxID=2782701 RepID=UPI003D23D60A